MSLAPLSLGVRYVLEYGKSKSAYERAPARWPPTSHAGQAAARMRSSTAPRHRHEHDEFVTHAHLGSCQRYTRHGPGDRHHPPPPLLR